MKRKRFLQKIIFLSLIAFLAFFLAASNRETSHNLLAYFSTDDCLIAPAVIKNGDTPQSCLNFPATISPTPTTAPTPNLSLPEKERFLAAVMYKLPMIPTPNSFEYILLRAYGAAFVNQQPEIKLPPKVLFTNEQETKQFQETLTMGKVSGANNCYLQKSAADALNKARTQVRIPLKSGYGASDCTRNFATNLRFWRKYASNKTLERVRQGQETDILGVVAPPGTSQHLWGLAVDLQATNAVQKQALYHSGWYQTVEKDVPHWTYLGLSPEKLAEFGFKNKVVGGITYWVTPL